MKTGVFGNTNQLDDEEDKLDCVLTTELGKKSFQYLQLGNNKNLKKGWYTNVDFLKSSLRG